MKLKVFAPMSTLFVVFAMLVVACSDGPTDADTKAKAPSAQDVEAGRLLCNKHGLTLRQDQHLRGKAYGPSATGQKAEEDERILKHIRGRVSISPRRPARGVDAEHVIRHGQIVIANLFRRLGEIADSRRIATDLGVDDGQCNAKLHVRPAPADKRMRAAR